MRRKKRKANFFNEDVLIETLCMMVIGFMISLSYLIILSEFK